MSAVIFHWELPEAWNNTQAAKKAFIRWSHTAKAFGITQLCMIDVDGKGGYPSGDSEIDLRIVKSLDEALSFYPDLVPVYVEEGGAPLFSYQFPYNPVFVFGSDFSELPKADVSIESLGPLNAEIAFGVVANAYRNR